MMRYDVKIGWGWMAFRRLIKRSEGSAVHRRATRVSKVCLFLKRNKYHRLPLPSAMYFLAQISHNVGDIIGSVDTDSAVDSSGRSTLRPNSRKCLAIPLPPQQTDWTSDGQIFQPDRHLYSSTPPSYCQESSTSQTLLRRTN